MSDPIITQTELDTLLEEIEVHITDRKMKHVSSSLGPRLADLLTQLYALAYPPA